METLAYATLIREYFAQGVQSYCAEDLHILVLLADEWALRLNYQVDPPEATVEVDAVVTKMAEAAEHASAVGAMNCGCYFPLPWIATLWNAQDQHFPAPTLEKHHAYLRLLHALEDQKQRGLLNTFNEESLPDLLRVAHDCYPGQCYKEDCHWRASSAEERDSGPRDRRVAWRDLSERGSNPRSELDSSADITPPIRPNVVETFNYLSSVAQGLGEITRDEVQGIMKLWREWGHPRTGYLPYHSRVPFFAVCSTFIILAAKLMSMLTSRVSPESSIFESIRVNITSRILYRCAASISQGTHGGGNVKTILPLSSISTWSS